MSPSPSNPSRIERIAPGDSSMGRRRKAKKRTTDGGGWRARAEKSRSSCVPSSESELALEQFVYRLRVRLTAGGFHHLADEPADQRGLGLRLLRLVRVLGNDVVDHLLDRGEVGYLL